MSLNVTLLEKVRELGNGIVQARCPACAEGGQDRKGEHLRIYPDGRFGCCVHPQDREHRQRVFALVGEKSSRSFTVKVASRQTPAKPARSVRAALAEFVGTPGTPESESVNAPGAPSLTPPTLGTVRTPVSESVSGSPETLENPRTLRTGFLKPYSYGRERENVTPDEAHVAHTCKDNERGVPSVLGGNVGGENQPAEETGMRLPFLTADGTLSIPFDSPERFHWWKGGQSISQTREEVRSWMVAKREEPDGLGI